MSAITTIETQAVSAIARLEGWQANILQTQIAKDCNPEELQYFLAVCRQIELDPFKKQIYAIKRGGKLTIQTGIDGLRAIASRTGTYAGSEAALFDEGLSAYEFAASGRKTPKAARVTVYRMVGGQRCSFTGEVLWTEFNQGQGQWSKAPCNQLAKCAEAAALRKAFPEMAGLDVGDIPDADPFAARGGGSDRPINFRQSKLWVEFMSAITRAEQSQDPAGKLQILSDWISGAIDQGKLPDQARAAVEQELEKAYQRVEVRMGQPLPTIPPLPVETIALSPIGDTV